MDFFDYRRIITPCAARLSSNESWAATAEYTTVQSVQMSAAARARKTEEKRKTFNAFQLLECQTGWAGG